MAYIAAQGKNSYDKQIINERITGQYIFDKEVFKTESEIIGDRYSHENLYEDERDVIPF